jgi:hypothetical protein
MSSLFGRRAVVVGGGIGGLSVAGVLAGCFEQVDVLERDRLTACAESRPGTAQDRHPHGLLAGGLKALGEIFPGFERDLVEAGAVSVGVAQDICYERADVGALPRRDFGLSILCASRPLIEFVLRRRVGGERKDHGEGEGEGEGVGQRGHRLQRRNHHRTDQPETRTEAHPALSTGIKMRSLIWGR